MAHALEQRRVGLRVRRALGGSVLRHQRLALWRFAAWSTCCRLFFLSSRARVRGDFVESCLRPAPPRRSLASGEPAAEDSIARDIPQVRGS